MLILILDLKSLPLLLQTINTKCLNISYYQSFGADFVYMEARSTLDPNTAN